jgi:hypothetical protein
MLKAHPPTLQALAARGGDLVAGTRGALGALLWGCGNAAALKEPAQHLVDAPYIGPTGEQLLHSDEVPQLVAVPGFLDQQEEEDPFEHAFHGDGPLRAPRAYALA